ncbi:tumor necrosis factor receptor superfamily member 14-like [Colossoma macropomum]|uniref:tumor necrosis factor receptor superfamily member 14-like n=1 Tax=Colossoma macropomum TaxID=42526 RepID=UPI0018641680|nr:tumor necrosis factor receptor superfamily member 14-like [Colossoma macropomum]XP_036435352.1 tumor necrosis factor receptor superfamily member 14-like [Colossoma macropomum]
MISGLQIIFIAAIISSNFEHCFGSCAWAEYEIGGECCPMCSPGNRVYRHCTQDTSTTCVPCLPSTFLDAPNGLIKCFSCAVCDPGQGLRVNTACTQSSNTVCEPVDGYYCTDQYSGSCRRADKHINCSPGQYIKQKGTASKDTECAECPDGTFSNGSLQICQPHSKCEDLGLTEIKPGTRSSDAECGNKTPAALIAGIIVSVLIVAVAAAVIVLVKIKCKTFSCRDWFEIQPAEKNHTTPVEETGFEESTALSSVMTMLTKPPDSQEPDQSHLNTSSSGNPAI